MWFSFAVNDTHSKVSISTEMFQIKLEFLAVLAVLIVANTFAKQNVEIEPRIILGQDAVRAQFPFFVFLEIESTMLTVKKFEINFIV